MNSKKRILREREYGKPIKPLKTYDIIELSKAH